MLTPFQFYTLLFHKLDEKWESCKDEELGMFLSEMSPYIWEGEGSADPAVYEEFKEFMHGKEIGDDYGFSLIVPYLESLDFYKDIKRFVADMNEKSWIAWAEEFFNNPPNPDDFKLVK